MAGQGAIIVFDCQRLKMMGVNWSLRRSLAA
jgi:hypothetical protein